MPVTVTFAERQRTLLTSHIVYQMAASGVLARAYYGSGRRPVSPVAE